MSQLYTSSRLKVFRECPRKHRLRYVLGLLIDPSPAMRFGTLVHAALEAWYRYWQANGSPVLDVASDVIDGYADIDEIDRIRARVIVTAYHARWCNEPWEILAVEVEFRYFLGDAEIGGKIDALIRDTRDGRVFVVEHKTSTADTKPGALYWDRLSVDTQVSVYIDGAAAGLDYDIAGCIYDVLQRPQHDLKLATPEESRRYTLGKGCAGCGGSAGGKKGVVQGRGFYDVVFGAEVKRVDCEKCAGTGWKVDDNGKPQAPHLDARQRDTDESLAEFEARLVAEISDRVDEFLARSTIVRLDHELPRMRQELLDTISSIEALEAADLAPPNHDACVRGRSVCAFFEACAGRASFDDFPRGDAHPELAPFEPAAEAA
jgi:hypothetical protein